MTAEPPQPTGQDGPHQTLLILGATGDLTRRLLLPGLGGLLVTEGAADLSVIGSSTQDWDDERWRREVAQAFTTAGAPGSRSDRVVGGARYVRADVTSDVDLRRLLGGCSGQLILYFALPPEVTITACEVLARVGVPRGSRLVLEKPFGTDASSAAALNELLTRLVPEEQIYRVDHYLGMSTVLSLLGLRFANRVLEPILNAEHVQGVEIVFDESLALEGRAGYYDGAGALIDMIQSHSLQVLSLLAMEPPSTLSARDLRDCTAQVLRATRVWDSDPVRYSRRARYAAGQVHGRLLPAYVDEEGVDPDRNTETYAEVVLAVDTWRWAGVPFRLRAAKALGSPRKEAVVVFKDPPWIPHGLTGYDRPNRLRVGFDPDWLRVELNINGEGDPSVIDPITLDATFGPGDLPPYGDVLARVLEGDPTLSVRGDAAVECWRIVAPVLRAWRTNAVPLEEYHAGSVADDVWPVWPGSPAETSDEASVSSRGPEAS
jgi:glucose-6-phosphate 1-dehydrogenase